MSTQALSPELQEIWATFAQEGRENLAAAEDALLRLEQNLSDPEQIKSLFRALHSFKGSARMMGLSQVESLAHHAEDLIALVRDEGVALCEEMVALLFTALDRLRSMLDNVVAQCRDVEPGAADDLIASLSQMIDRAKSTAPAEETSLRADAPAQVPTGAVVLESDRDATRSGIDTENTRAAETSATTELQAATTMDDRDTFLRTAESGLGELHSTMDAFAAGASDAPARGGSTIPTEVVDRLSDQVGTLVASHTSLHRIAGRLGDGNLVETALQLFDNMDGEGKRFRSALQELLSKWMEGVTVLSQVDAEMANTLEQIQGTTRALRLVPASQILNPLQSYVQELARQQGRQIELDSQGAELELDRKAVQTLGEPLCQLVHLVITQGIEDAEERRAAGKPTTARVSVVVSAREDHVQITLEDDGRGIGEENSVLVEVSEALRLYQGKLNIASRAGKGTRLALRLPIEMAVLDGMVVRAGSVRYVIPVNAIRRIVKTDATTLIHSSAEGNHYWLRLDRELIPIRTLVGDGQITNAQELVVVIEGEQHVVGLRVDELIGQQHVVVRPLEGAFAQIEDATGCALLGEGEVGVVLSRDLAVSQA